jgi:hypothetical protein
MEEYLHNFKGIAKGRGLPPLNPMECEILFREHSSRSASAAPPNVASKLEQLIQEEHPIVGQQYLTREKYYSDQVCPRDNARGYKRSMVEVSETSTITPIEHPAMLCEHASEIARAFCGWCQPLS